MDHVVLYQCLRCAPPVFIIGCLSVLSRWRGCCYSSKNPVFFNFSYCIFGRTKREALEHSTTDKDEDSLPFLPRTTSSTAGNDCGPGCRIISFVHDRAAIPKDLLYWCLVQELEKNAGFMQRTSRTRKRRMRHPRKLWPRCVPILEHYIMLTGSSCSSSE